MITFGEKTVLEVIAITCDCCKTVYNDNFEMQEFLSWSNSTGYGNHAFGDMHHLSLDLCQYCTKKLLNDYITDSAISWHANIEDCQ